MSCRIRSIPRPDPLYGGPSTCKTSVGAIVPSNEEVTAIGCVFRQFVESAYEAGAPQRGAAMRRGCLPVHILAWIKEDSPGPRNEAASDERIEHVDVGIEQQILRLISYEDVIRADLIQLQDGLQGNLGHIDVEEPVPLVGGQPCAQSGIVDELRHEAVQMNPLRPHRRRRDWPGG